MNSIYLDPYTLAYPNNHEELEPYEFENYLENILLWRQLKDIPLTEVMVSKQTSRILMEQNNYPYWDSLREALLKKGLIGFYQPKDIIEVIDGFLQQPTIEESLGLVDILFDDVIVYPDEHLERRPTMYIDEYKKVALFYLIHDLIREGEERYFITRDSVSEIEIKGEVYACDFIKKDSDNFKYPILINGKVHSQTNWLQLITNFNVVSSWKIAETDEDYFNLINLYLLQRLSIIGENPLDTDIPTWKYGHSFFETCRSLGFTHEEGKIKALLKACADTILDQNLSSTHTLRIDESGNSPQLMRNRDKAWRRDIDYEYHLHYWKTSNGPELAAVVVHNNMWIPI
ncbi:MULTISPECIES: hypothetical protein [Paenibacillus]|uniref:Uncharacterized protein n=1 Tax=Paenibacillus macerans TaxID=44252 RepID=A0A090ZHL3_PAEMA|nr:hypothetical protein [Paenibacillus macerans]KFN09710.1 hypothetical protein DJ90_3521 [Paenibacillus macerans]MCY7559758.1 hypothetical protein [Paenibacillus macerans]MEC0151167.1 hypothetical protein [Paenibacillus macerans]OMG51004.1 hypothetical protein BK140_03765 [Paenibacillus macerans]SUA82310.1 Uncharacterised protein [Paenibacillus macerans]